MFITLLMCIYNPYQQYVYIYLKIIFQLIADLRYLIQLKKKRKLMLLNKVIYNTLIDLSIYIIWYQFFALIYHDGSQFHIL